VARFIASYHLIRNNEAHDKLQLDLIDECWNGEDNKISVYMFVCLLYCWNTICCIYSWKSFLYLLGL
jgi:hypothetical protein